MHEPCDIYMQHALQEARKAAARDEVPIGAVVIYKDKVIAADGNRTRELNDPTAHAEILVIRQACQELGAQRIPDCELYVTLEPCAMCAAAIAFARIQKLYIGALDEKGGGVLNGIKFFEQPTCHHKKIDILAGCQEIQSRDLLKAFFKGKRSN